MAESLESKPLVGEQVPTNPTPVAKPTPAPAPASTPAKIEDKISEADLQFARDEARKRDIQEAVNQLKVVEDVKAFIENKDILKKATTGLVLSSESQRKIISANESDTLKGDTLMQSKYLVKTLGADSVFLSGIDPINRADLESFVKNLNDKEDKDVYLQAKKIKDLLEFRIQSVQKKGIGGEDFKGADSYEQAKNEVANLYKAFYGDKINKEKN